MARLQWTPAWSVGLLIVAPTLFLLLLVQLPYSTVAAQRLQMSSSSTGVGAVLDTAARGLTEETVTSHDLKLQQEMQKSTPSLHDENTNEVSKDKATSGVTMDSASGAVTAAAVEEADVIGHLRVERLLCDYCPTANTDPGVPTVPSP